MTSTADQRIAYLGLGANLGIPRDAILQAIELLQTPEIHVSARAPLYRSPPLGPVDQPDFVNTVVKIETELTPEQLLAHCKSVETDMGRTPSIRWGPRLIDIDILVYDQTRLKTPQLTLPHPELHRRRFVLTPLAALAPDLIIPGLEQTVKTLEAQLHDEPWISQIP